MTFWSKVPTLYTYIASMQRSFVDVHFTFVFSRRRSMAVYRSRTMQKRDPAATELETLTAQIASAEGQQAASYALLEHYREQTGTEAAIEDREQQLASREAMLDNLRTRKARLEQRMRGVLRNAAGLTFGEAISRARTSSRRRWSQEEVGKQVGKSRVAVSNWERDVFLPEPATFARVCELYDTSPEQLGFLIRSGEIVPAHPGSRAAKPSVVRDMRTGNMVQVPLLRLPDSPEVVLMYVYPETADGAIATDELPLDRSVPVPVAATNGMSCVAVDLGTLLEGSGWDQQVTLVFRVGSEPKPQDVVLASVGPGLAAVKSLIFQDGRLRLFDPFSPNQESLFDSDPRILGVACGVIRAFDDRRYDVTFTSGSIIANEL